MTVKNQLVAFTILTLAFALVAEGQNRALPPTVSMSRFAYGISDDSRLSVYLENKSTSQLRNIGYVPVPGDGASALALDPQSRFVYVTNSRTNDVAAFVTNPHGLPTWVGNTPAGGGPSALAVDPTGHFIYVANQNSGDVFPFKIDPGSGMLLLAGPVLPAGSSPSALTVDPTGQFVYVANQSSNDVSMYRIDLTSGALMPIGPNVHAGTGPSAVTVDPLGKFVYVTNSGSNDVSTFKLDPNTGQLDQLGNNVPAGVGPASIAVGHAGQFAYVANSGSNDVSTFHIDPATGSLALVSSAPAGNTPVAVTLDPSGQFVFVANDGSGDLYAYDVNNGNGGLAYDHGSNTGNLKEFGLEFSFRFIPILPRFAYVVDAGDLFNSTQGDVAAYAVDPNTGSLTSLGTNTPAGLTPLSIAVVGGPFHNQFAYVTNTGFKSGTPGDISSYSIDPLSGALSSLGANVAADDYPYADVVDPSGRFLYVSNTDSNDISTFSIDALTGALTQIGQNVGSFGDSPHYLTTDPAGRFLYVANHDGFGTGNNISIFKIDANSGGLSPAGGVSMLTVNVEVVRFCLSGKFAYAASPQGILTFAVDGLFGTLTQLGSGTSADGMPNDLVVDPTGRFAYVPNFSSNDISAYRIDAKTGMLTSLGPTVPAGSNPAKAAIDPQGRFLYVTNDGGNSISEYHIDPTYGFLYQQPQTPKTGNSPYGISLVNEIE